MLRDVNFACRIHPAAQSDIGEQQWVTGLHCVWSVIGWLIVYEDGHYLYPGQYSKTICQSQIGWYRLWGRNILMARRSTFLESRFWRSHVCGTLLMPLLGNVYFLCNKILLDIKAKSTENMTVQQAFSFWPSQLLHDFFFLFWAIVQCNQIFFLPMKLHALQLLPWRK